MHCGELDHDLTMDNLIDNELYNCERTDTALDHFLEYPLYIVQRNQLIFSFYFN